VGLRRKTGEDRVDALLKKAERLERQAAKHPEHAGMYEQLAQSKREQAQIEADALTQAAAPDEAAEMTKVEKKAARHAAQREVRQSRDKRRAESKHAQQDEKAELASYRRSHPLEVQLNHAALMHRWPKATHGETSSGPVKGAHSELFNANAHKKWTATRLASNATVGVATAGIGMTGRKNVGQAEITIQQASGAISTYRVKPQDLNAANKYVVAFNAYAEQLAREDEQQG
jgi:hypothetical protein